MKNKQVKQMMCDVFDGYWSKPKFNGEYSWLCLMVDGGHLGNCSTVVGLYKTVSIKGDD